MSYWSVEIETPVELADWLSWLIAERLEVAVEIQDGETLTPGPELGICLLLVRTEEEPSPEWVKGVQDCLVEVGCPTAMIRSRHDNDDSWRLGWRAFFKATEVAKDIIVRPPWVEETEAAIEVVIDPGLAFGTGTHATTQLAATLLVNTLKDAPQKRVLDQGCGSGILSFIAAQLGHSVIGIEIDPVAVRSATENLPLNGLSEEILSFQASDQVPSGPFDVVIANIIASVLIELAASIGAVAQERIILSGMLIDQEMSVLKAYPKWSVVERLTRGEWVGVVLERAGGEGDES